MPDVRSDEPVESGETCTYMMEQSTALDREATGVFKFLFRVSSTGLEQCLKRRNK